jgi:hypothetical protein
MAGERRAGRAGRARAGKRRGRLLGVASILATGLAATGALAGSTAEATDGPAPAARSGEPRPHRLHYGLAIGYGHGIAPRSRQQGRDVADVRILTFEPQLRAVLARIGDGSAWYHGELDGMLEGLFMLNLEPSTGYAGGVSPGLRYRFQPAERVQPFVGAAIGLGALDFDLASQDDGFTFFLAAELGARIRLDARWSLETSLRWQHVSNAQTHLPNNGIDTVGFRIGVAR